MNDGVVSRNLNKTEQDSNIKSAINLVLRLIEAECSILTSGIKIHKKTSMIASGSCLASVEVTSICSRTAKLPKISEVSKCFITIVTKA